ncbi:MAG: cob(I)yrinic acid a,c-diamide adenosyltransferase [Chloroflexota bacterium]
MSSKFYTRTGDEGETGLLGKDRVTKDHPRLEAVGSVDEANAALGIARAICQAPQSPDIILAVQRDLYNLMAETAASVENAEQFRVIQEQRVKWLEDKIEAIGSLIEPTHEFIVPGDTAAGAALDFARAVVRRAERRLVRLHQNDELENTQILRYINRLSSLCFVLELLENQESMGKPPTKAKETQ